MAKLTILEECIEATGIKEKKGEKRQDFLDRLVKGCQDLKDDDWEQMSEAAQKWVNKAAKAVNDDEEIAEPADAKKPEADKPERTSRRSRDEDAGDDDKGKDDDEDKPRSRRGRDADDDDDKPKKGDKDKAKDKDDDKGGTSRRRGRDADDDAEDKPARRSRDKDDDEKEKPEKETRTSRSKDKADKDDDKPAKKPAKKGEGAQASIKRAVIKSPTSTTEEVVAALAKKGLDVTSQAVSTIRSGTLQTLRLIQDIGMPKGDF